MPGTIQVSVIGLMDLPSSSSPISVQVSMGKKEYQTWDKGDFSFPVLTLRDNLVITLYNTEGNELSRTDVETLSVIEKGFLDEFVHLEGGRRFHLTLQFILTKEDRKRIQDVRATALKKKQVELLTSSSQRHLETAALASVGGNAVSSFSINHEVTDSQGPVEMEATSNTRGSIHDGTMSKSDSCAEDSIPGSGNVDEVSLNSQGQPSKISPGFPVDMEAASNARGSIHDGTMSKSDSCAVDSIPGSGNEDEVPLYCQGQPDHISLELPVEMEAASNTRGSIQNDSISKSDICTKDPIPGSGKEDLTPLNCQEQPDQVKVPDDICTKDPLSDSGNEEGILLNRPKQPDQVRVSDTCTDIPMKPISSLNALDHQLGFTKSLVTKHSQPVSGTSQEDHIRSPENQGAMKRTSSVKNMISAFESNLSQIFSSPYHALTLKSQLKKTMTEGTLKGPNVQVTEKNRIQDTAEKEPSSSSILESQGETLQQSLSAQKDEIGPKQHKEGHVNETVIPRDELDGKSADNTTIVLRRVPVYFPSIEPPTVKSQQSQTTIEGSVKGLNVEEATSETSKAHKVVETEMSLTSTKESHEVNLLESMTSVTGEGDEVGLKPHIEENVNEHGALLEEVAGTSAVEIDATSGMEQHEEETVIEHRRLLEELPGTSTLEMDAISRRMVDKPVDRDQSLNARKDQQGSSREVLRSDECRMRTEDSDMLDILVSFDSSGSCIFLDESRHLCITTGSKQVMDVVCSCDVLAETDKAKTFSTTEAPNKEDKVGNACKEVNKNGKSSSYLREPKLERSADVGDSGRLFGQAVRIAVMVAFGTFVFITRERKNG